MNRDIPLPDFSFIEASAEDFATQLEPLETGIPFPNVPIVVAHFGFSLPENSLISCTTNSSVYQAVDRDGNICALKVSRVHNRLLAELDNRLNLGECPFLVSSFDIFQVDQYSILQMELCLGGDVRAQQLSELECWQLMATVGSALAHIHANEFLHLDVSPSNIFRSEWGFKLGDFGTLKVNGEFKLGDEGAGAYAAPEVFNEPDNVSGAADIFSLGVCLLEAVSGRFAPRGGEPKYLALRAGKFGLGDEGYPCQASLELKQVINTMLHPDPDARPCAMLIAVTAQWALENLEF